jgi:hypothetical protein
MKSSKSFIYNHLSTYYIAFSLINLEISSDPNFFYFKITKSSVAFGGSPNYE